MREMNFLGNFKHKFFIFLLCFVFCACPAEDRIDRLQERDLVIESSSGPVILRTEIARTQEEQSRGYMHRQVINDGEGMLFYNETDRMMSFWMANTYVALSIAFISSDGTILEIYDMEPLSLAPVQSSRSVRHALEVPQGWFTRAGIGVGDRIQIEQLRN